MRSMSVIAHRIAMTLGLFLGAALVQSSSAAITIGDIHSFGHPLTAHYKMGLELAVEEINEEGGVRGELIELLARDDLGTPEVAVRTARELIYNERVCCILGGDTAPGALARLAEEGRVLLLAPLLIESALLPEHGNRHTFRLRPSAYVQAAMLATEVASSHAKYWATIAPDSAYGREVVAAFKAVLGRMRSDVRFVEELWIGPLQRDLLQYAQHTQALVRSEAEGILSGLKGRQLSQLASAGGGLDFFEGRLVVSPIIGEPEFLDPMQGRAPEGWLVTGYPWYDFEARRGVNFRSLQHSWFVRRYQRRYNTYPRMASLLGYTAGRVIAAAIARAGGTDIEAMVNAMETLEFEGPSGTIRFRREDHQSTMGAYVGWTRIKEGRGRMVQWMRVVQYLDGGDYLPSGQFH